MIAEKFLQGLRCKWCRRALGRSHLKMMLGGIEKDEAILYPVLCICGGMNVIGGELIERQIDQESPADRRL